MKCPKCGYNSFEYYDSCKKCSDDLIGYKLSYKITPLVLPLESKEHLAADFQAGESPTAQSGATTKTHDDIFSFDLPEASSSTPAQHHNDPFSFDELSPDLKQSNKSEDDTFGDLLESTSQTEDSPFSASQAATAPTSAAAKKEDSSSVPGEFDLESFSWDDAPDATAVPDSKVDDDFDSLFGDTKENSQK